MMRFSIILFLFPWVMASCQTSSTKPATSSAAVAPVAAGAFKMAADTIEIRGKFLQGCTMPRIIKVAEHNEMNSPWKEVTVNANGEFSYRLYLSEPRRIALRTEKKANYDFMATTKEKVYQIEIACYNAVEKLELKGSAENAAYHLFSNANKKFRYDLDAVVKQDISKPEEFAKLKNTIAEYQKTISGIASANPSTFTATVLCAGEKFPDAGLNSLEALRQNFLQREVFANPNLYNDFLGQRILINYIALSDRKADQYETINRLMTIALKNPEAAKRLQQITYNLFYNMREEPLLKSYIQWADTNPNAMYNPGVKIQLSKLKRVVAGSQVLDIQLDNPEGELKKLSEAVNSSNLTLLIFYSPTCEHCQAEIPQIKPIWDQYKSKGLKIYAVGFDATPEEWDWFIKNKAYPEWTHVFEYPDGLHPSDSYVVNFTPSFILINRQGKIISRMGTLETVKEDIPRLLN